MKIFRELGDHIVKARDNCIGEDIKCKVNRPKKNKTKFINIATSR